MTLQNRFELQPTSYEIWDSKYRLKDEQGNCIDQTVLDSFKRVAGALAKVEESSKQEYWYERFLWAMLHGAVPAGRIISNAGAEQYKPNTSTINCTVSSKIADSMDSILTNLHDAGMTLKSGCGIGYEFSTLRPKGAYVAGAGAYTSGPLSFMDIYDKMCFTISSAGGRRGAQMATFDIRHPDVMEFIQAKREAGRLRQFNLSLLITHDFMEAVKKDQLWDFTFPLGSENVYKTIRARELWNQIMQSNYEYAEPGFLLIDEINRMNNNWWCEDIRATNPSLGAGTLVHTKKGIFKIEELENKEFQVRALDGSWGNAKCWLSSDNAKTITLCISGGEKIICTPEHKWPVLDKLTNRVVRTLTSDLKIGDEIPKPLAMPLEIEGDLTLTEEDGFFLGVWLADGHMTKRSDSGSLQIGFTFNKLDMDMAERILKYVNGNKKYESNLCEREGSFEFSFQGESALMLSNKFNIYPGAKEFPEIVYTSNDNFVRGFVDGVISGDGYVEGCGKQRIILRQKSESVIRGVMRLLSFMGISGNLCYSESIGVFPNGKDYGKKYGSWSFKISKIAAKKFATIFNLTCCRKQDALNEIIESNGLKMVERNAFVVVENKINNNNTQPVWDISVDHPQHLFPIAYCYTGNCGEQPLGPNGSCLLGSIDLTQFVGKPFTSDAFFDWGTYSEVIRVFTRMLDNVVEINGLPLESQRKELELKRRHGMGYFGLGSVFSMMCCSYGSEESIRMTRDFTEALAIEGYMAGLELAKEKGPAPIMNMDFEVTEELRKKRPDLFKTIFYPGDTVKGKYLHSNSEYMKRIAKLEPELVMKLEDVGCRFTHHSSIAPTGSVALSFGNNASNGIEPSFAHHYVRNVIIPGKKTKEQMDVYSKEALLYRELMVGRKEELPDYCKTANQITPKEHIDIQAAAQYWIDSSISKTVNVPSDCTMEQFQDIYQYAYDSGLKGCATFRFNPDNFQGVLVNHSDLNNTTYQFILENGETVTVNGSDTIEYEGETHGAANLFDALKEGLYGKF